MSNGKMDFTHYSVIRPDAGTVDEWHCALCGAKAKVSRNQYGPRSFATAIGKIYNHYDLFECPYINYDWHRRAHALKDMIDETPSPTLKGIFKNDFNNLLKNNPKDY